MGGIAGFGALLWGWEWIHRYERVFWGSGFVEFFFGLSVDRRSSYHEM
jgi:hypothetical protein